MSRSRTGLAQGAVLSGACALTVLVTVVSWRGLTEDAARFLVPLFFIGLVNAGIGTLTRWLRWPVWAVFVVQVVVAAVLVLGVVTGSALPGPETLAQFGAAVRDAMDTSTRYAAPVPARVPPVTPLLLMGGVGGMLLVDLVAVSWQRVALAGLPLLALYSLPASLPAGGVSWWLFALMSGGFLLMLFLQHDEHLSRWGRGLNPREEDADPTAFGVRTGAVRGTAFAMGGIATALAIVVPTALPSVGLDLFDGPGIGSGGDVAITSPMVDLRRDLVRDEDVPLMQVSTSGPRPDYARISVLTKFNGSQWTPGNRDIPTSQVARGTMPRLQGVADVLRRKESSYSFQASDNFASTWLPTVSSVTSIDAPGDWRFDRKTMDFIASTEGLTTAGRRWDMTGVDLTYDETRLDEAAPGNTGVSLEFLDIPDNLPPIVRDLASQVTADEPTEFRKARALQNWFRSEFTYSLDNVDVVDNSGLEDFLSEDGRVGYCEQFAASMALMARSIGIPARVAVGFLQPDALGPGRWQFSSHDLHAWPELYFAGSGWVRFEPTPADRAPDTPGYTEGNLPVTRPTVAPSSGATSGEAVPDRTTEDPSAVAGETGGASQSFPWLLIASILAGLALAVGLLLLPRLVRQRRRQARWHAGGIESAWQELRDSVVDLGHAWPAGRSPRAAGLAVAGLFGADTAADQQRPARGPELAPRAVAALDRLVVRVERSRYARPGSGTGVDDAAAVRSDVEECVASIGLGVTPRTRQRAKWWPSSVLKRDRAAPSDVPEVQVVTGGGVTDHVG